MKKLLEGTSQKTWELPETEQDTPARCSLEEPESEREWDRLSAGSHDVLDRLAKEAT